MQIYNEPYRVNALLSICGSSPCKYYIDFTKEFPIPVYIYSDWIMSNCGRCPQYCAMKIRQDGMVIINGEEFDYVRDVLVLNDRDKLAFDKLKLKFGKESYRLTKELERIDKMTQDFLAEWERKYI